MARRQDIETRLTATDKTKAAFNRVQKRMKSLKKVSLVAGAGVVAMAAGFAAAGKKAIDFADNIAKTSDRIGMTTKNFQEMAHSFDLAGVSTEQFSSAAAGLQKRIGDLNEDTGSLFTILKDDQAFATLLKGTTDTSEAIRIMVEKLSSTKNAMDRAALASAAFGRSAGSAIAKIDLSELDAGIKTARKFGIAIDEDLLRNAEKMKDAFTTAMATFKGAFFSGMLEAMNKMNLTKLAKDLSTIAVASVKAAGGIASLVSIFFPDDTGIDELTESLKKAHKEYAELRKEITKTKEGEELLGALPFLASRAKSNQYMTSKEIENLKRLNDVLATMRRGAQGKNNPIDRLSRLSDLTKSLQERIDKLNKTQLKPLKTDIIADAPLYDETGAQENKLTALYNKLMLYRDGITKTKDQLTVLNQTEFSSVEGMEKATAAMQQKNERLKETAKINTFLDSLVKNRLSISDETRAAIIAESVAVGDLNRALVEKMKLLTTTDSPIQAYVKNIKSMRHSLEEAAISGADSLTNSLMGIIDGTQKAGEAFKSFARGIIAQLTKMIIKKLIFDRIFGMISAAMTPTPPALANGGPASAGRPYMVGERGPELMVPNRSGTVIPNHALGGGGAVINQTINIQTGVSQTVRAEILTLMPQINQATKAAVLDARQRGGSFANGFS